MTIEQAKNILNNMKGEFFTICFVKRTNGEKRIMNCRFGVKKYVTGEGLKFEPKERNLLVVFDVHKEQYRMINLESIIWIKANHNLFA